MYYRSVKNSKYHYGTFLNTTRQATFHKSCRFVRALTLQYRYTSLYYLVVPSSRIQPQPWFKLYSPGWLVFFGGRLVGAPPQVPPPPWMDSQQRLPWAGFCLHEPACTCQNGPSHLKLSFSDEPRCTISSKQPRRRTTTISDQ